MAQLLSFGFDWSHQPYPIKPKIGQQAFAMPLGAFIHNLDITPETIKGTIPINKGGTGGTTLAEVRTNLGLGSAALKNVGETTGDLMQVGAFGVGANSTPTLTPAQFNDPSKAPPTGFYTYRDIAETNTNYKYSHVIVSRYGTGKPAMLGIQAFYATPRIYFKTVKTDAAVTEYDYSGFLYHTSNTTVDANGFIKAASPIANLFANSIELNDEAKQQQITFERVDRGHYLIKGSSGFAQEGWYIELPKDANGNVKFAVEYQTLENGDIEIKTYKKNFDFETFSIVADHNHPIDIEDGRFISLRLQELPQPEIEDFEEPSLAPADFQPTNLAQAVAEYMEADVPSVLTEQEPAE